MRVYLIAAPEDESEAEKLSEYLKRFGVFIRSEYGRMAYPPAHHGEFTLALWSRNAMMSSRQMMLTNRAIDAWADGQLVMARLEPGLNPRGLSDLEMVDLTFAREHRYHDVLNALRALQDAQRRAQQAPLPSPGSSEGGPGGPQEDAQDDDWLGGRAYSVEAEESELVPTPASPPQSSAAEALPDIPPAKAASGGGAGRVLIVFLGLILLIGLVTVFGFNFLSPGAPMGSLQAYWPYALGGGVTLLLLIGWLSRPRKKHHSKAKSRQRATSEAPASPAPKEAPAVTRDTPHQVFVSYSHQNAETVLPIVETVEAQGLSIWIDKEEMRAGQGWAGQIVRAIKSAERFCLMCSEQSFSSDHVRREVYLADKYGKAMVPVRLDGAEMPEDIEYFLAGRQWIDLTSLSEDEQADAIHGALSITTS